MGNAARRREVKVPRKRPIKQAPHVVHPRAGKLRESGGVLIGLAALFTLFALYTESSYWAVSSEVVRVLPGARTHTMGPLGTFVARQLFELLGWCAFVVPILGFPLAYALIKAPPSEDSETPTAVRLSLLLVGIAIAVVSAAIFLSTFYGYEAGGLVGDSLHRVLARFVGDVGTVLVSVAAVLLAISVGTEMQVLSLFQASTAVTSRMSKGVAASARRFGEQVRERRELTRALAENAAKSSQEYYDEPLPEVPSTSVWSRFFSSKSVEEDLEAAVDEDNEDSEEESPRLKRRSGTKLKRMRERAKRRLAAKNQQLEGEDDGEDNDEETDGETLDVDDDLVIDQTPVRINRPEAREASKKAASKAAETAAEKEREKADAERKRGKLRLKKRGKLLRRRSRDDEDATTDADTAEADLVPEKIFDLPTLDLLIPAEPNTQRGPKDEELIRNSRLLEKTLLDFRIGGKIVEVEPGPVITLYEFAPAAGVKVQRIVSLADDIALALKVASVRVYAPVPGKGTVGIEVPNADREIVRLRDILASDEFAHIEAPLTLALGKDTFGSPVVADLSRMPHLLIAGATGTGKSVCLNSMLLSLLYRNTPEQLRFIMIDPKMLELSLYEEIPHLKAPVVTNPKRARGVLWWAVEEMERRYRLMKDLGVRNLASYNRLASGEDPDGGSDRAPGDEVIELKAEQIVSVVGGQVAHVGEQEAAEPPPKPIVSRVLQPLPRIVIVVDELADLMLTVGREVEELFTRLAQKARAAGIHLILATQRPSVNVITGLIKANFPARISFQVASKIDARTVLDHSGAEKLLGQGDMLFMAAGTGRVRRLHAAFVSDGEVQRVVELLKRQAPPDYDPEIDAMIKRVEEAEGGTGGGGEDNLGEVDAIYDQAVNLVIEKGFASTSMVQRYFRIGYNRAARVLEMMEREGVVGPADGAKPRQVFVHSQE